MSERVCIFCIGKRDTPIENDPADRVIKEYENWLLVLQPKAKRQKTKQAAGMLIAKRHVEVPSKLNAQEAVELFAIYKDASQKLCNHVGVTYTEQESVGFNEGIMAGQTIEHAHIHILPVAEEDPAALRVRGGIGGAFEACVRNDLMRIVPGPQNDSPPNISSTRLRQESFYFDKIRPWQT